MDSINKYLKKSYSRRKDVISKFLSLYDKNGKGYLTLEQFRQFVEETLDLSGTTSKQQNDATLQIFQLLDANKDGGLDEGEWKMAWSYWLKQVLCPVTAMIVVDVQNDFISGSLALSGCPAGQDGTSVIPVINSILDQAAFDVVVYSKDWHPKNHISFIDNVNLRMLHPSSKVKAEDAVVTDTVKFAGPPPTEQVMWPTHCVQGSPGAHLHPDLKVVENSHIVNKGTHPDVDSYSAFWDNNKMAQTELVDLLAEHKVTDVYVCGLAYDVCVGSTALHAVEHGFRTTLIEDACRGVSLQGIDSMRRKLTDNSVHIVSSHQVNDLVTARTRPLIHALKAAENYALARKIVQTKQN